MTQYKRFRSQAVFVFIAVASILIALNGASALSYVVPIAYLLATTGIAYVIHEWLQVFPHNPLARIAGVSIVFALTGLVIYYNLTNYFVAWRYSPETTAVFQEKI
jgi:uncharacterized membrane protein YoaT (DUF817 family)